MVVPIDVFVTFASFSPKTVEHDHLEGFQRCRQKFVLWNAESTPKSIDLFRFDEAIFAYKFLAI